METRGVTLQVGDRSVASRLAVPAEPRDAGVLVLPAASHGPFGGVFDHFVAYATAAGFHALRFETWADRSDLARLSAADLHADIDAGLAFLEWWGCETVAIVAKSYGARIALTRGPAGIDRMVLWSPAILVDEETTGPTIAPLELATVDVPVRVVHGGGDRVVSVETAADIVRHLPNGELVELAGEDHLFGTDPDRVVERTMSFLELAAPAERHT